MKLPRRQFLHLAAGAAALPTVSLNAWAQAYPTKPVRVIVGFAPGSSPDIVARLMGQWLTANAINATLYEKLNFNFSHDIAPVAGIIRVPNVMEVNLSIPAETVPEFIAYAKANPGKVSMASSGTGATPHVAGELFKMMTGVDMVHVPYRGGAPALTDLLGGSVQIMFGTMPESIEYIRAGKLRALAVTAMTRSEALPDVPTVSDFLPGYEASSWHGVGVPKSTPVEIVDRLNKEINAVLADPKMKARLADLGGTILGGSAADFRNLVGVETEKWAKVVKFSGAKPD